MAKLKLDLTDLQVDSFDPAPHDRRRGTVMARGSDWGLCSGGSCEVFCSYNNPSCYGSCDTVCIDCHTNAPTCFEPGCDETRVWSCPGTTCVGTCMASCAESCNCTVPDTCPCI